LRAQEAILRVGERSSQAGQREFAAWYSYVPGGAVSRILLVDDDLGTVETFSAILRLEGFGVETAASAGEAVERARCHSLDLLLIDLCLPDLSGIDLLRCLRANGIEIPAIIMTGFASIASAVEATRFGVLDYLEKPIFDNAIVAAVRRGLGVPNSTPSRPSAVTTPAASAAAKWAELVLAAIVAEGDLRNLQEWGRLHGVSRGTVENRCEAAGVDAKASLDFARMLRAIAQAPGMNCAPEALLDVDPRTLRRLFSIAGLSSSRPAPTAPPTAIQFLDSQQFILEPLALEAVRRALK
jgi:FixJ family two-component response regulator